MPVVERLGLEQIDSCRPLLACSPFHPYGHYVARLGNGALESLHFARLRACREADGAEGLIIPGPAGASALAIWRRLAWDSQQLGVEAGQLCFLLSEGGYQRQQELSTLLLERVLERCGDQGIRLLSARLDSSDGVAIHLLERHGFLLVDGILTFSVDLERASAQSPCRPDLPAPFLLQGVRGYTGQGSLSSAGEGPAERPAPPHPDVYHHCLDSVTIRAAGPGDLDHLKALARRSYAHDRFHSDPLIPRQAADNVYAAWIENACLGHGADVVIVAERNGCLEGYVSCALDREAESHLGLRIGTIGLVATAPEARGHGLARAIIAAALEWFWSQGAVIVEVGTQLRNLPAARLYESMGFRLVSTSVSFHKWLG